jgi:hypothetical protein
MNKLADQGPFFLSRTSFDDNQTANSPSPMANNLYSIGAYGNTMNPRHRTATGNDILSLIPKASQAKLEGRESRICVYEREKMNGNPIFVTSEAVELQLL